MHVLKYRYAEFCERTQYLGKSLLVMLNSDSSRVAVEALHHRVATLEADCDEDDL